MPFVKHRDCSLAHQTAIGLMEPNCPVPRTGERTRVGAHGVNIVSCSSHAQPLSQPDALRLWGLIPQAEKDHPQSPEHAQSLSLLAQMAGRNTPDGCADLLPNDMAQVENVTFYHTLGSPLFKVRQTALRFISFVYYNTDQGHRVLWQEMTGQEQYEWYNAFVAAGETYLRHEQATNGLRGTNMDRIHNAPQLAAVMQRSPSVAHRRSPHHRIPAQQWDTVRRNLFGA